MSSNSNDTITPLSGASLWLAAIVLGLANFVAVLDLTIANVSVPNISGSLGASNSQGTWVITSYAVAEAIVVPLTGWLAARFGAVRVFVWAISLFGIFSTLCGLANSLGFLIAARIFQGLAGGPLIPLSQTLLLRIFPKQKAAAATAIWAVTTLTAPIAGPLLGGWLCDMYSWHLIFFINVPITLLCGFFAWRLLTRYNDKIVRAPIDLIGLGLLIIWVGALQLLLDLGKEHDWFASPLIIWLGIISVIGFAAFLIWELTGQHPVVDLRVFRHRGYSVAVFTICLGFGSIFAVNVLTPLWLQTYMGYTATWAGMTSAWVGVLAVLAAPVVGAMVGRRGADPRKMVCAGLLWLGLIVLVRSFLNTDMTYWQIATPLIFMGIGLPMFFVAITQLALGNVDESETASAAGLMNFLRTVSGAFATSMVTTAWEDSGNYYHAELASSIDPGGETVRRMLDSGMTMDIVRSTLDRMVDVQAIMLATNQIMFSISLIFLLGACAIWLAPKPTHSVDTSAAH